MPWKYLLIKHPESEMQLHDQSQGVLLPNLGTNILFGNKLLGQNHTVITKTHQCKKARILRYHFRPALILIIHSYPLLALEWFHPSLLLQVCQSHFIIICFYLYHILLMFLKFHKHMFTLILYGKLSIDFFKLIPLHIGKIGSVLWCHVKCCI